MSNSVFQVLLLLVSLTVPASGATPRLANRGCAETCGNVTIPFPFGIGTGCFLDDWYEIVCQQNHTVPILNKIGLRVLDILLPNFTSEGDGMIKVSLPVIYSNASCKGHGLGEPVSLEGSDFFFSQRWNVFTSVGSTEATVISKESAGIVFTSSGCRSKCAGTNTNISWSSACSGADGCCQTTLPLNLQAFGVDIKEEGGQQGCKYAFLAERSWFSKADVTGLYDLRVKDKVPVVLQWGIQNNTDYSLALRNSSMNSDVVSCYMSRTPLECWCRDGYGGNPYFIGGCQDINECEDSNICHRMDRTCVNKRGGYDCVDSRKTAKVILIGK